MTAAAPHVAHVFPTPWKSAYSTHIVSGRTFGRHWHDTYGFGLVERGAHRSASGRGLVRAYAGDVITTNPGEVHDGQPLDGPTRRWRILYIDADAMASMSGADQALEITRPVLQDARLVRALKRLFRRIERFNVQRATGDAALACEEALVESSVLLMSRHGGAPLPAGAADVDVALVRDRLADDAMRPPSLAELASMTGLSRYQVLRRFQQVYGLPPHAWLLRQRAERARMLIRNGLTLSDAAAASGFADQSHMTRIFSRQFGFTPGAWKAAIAQ